MDVLICGTSTRAAAESAARAGYRVTALDAFADLDQHPSVRALSMPRDVGRPATAAAIARAARTFDAEAVVYLSPFENHHRAVASLAARRRLWGNPPGVVRRARDPHAVAGVFAGQGFRVPGLAGAMGHTAGDGASGTPDRWLVKPARSGGGRRIRVWRGGHVPATSYLQERIDGMPGSVAFVAAEGKAVAFAVSRQLIGDARFGASGFRYCGSILAPADDPQFEGGRALAAEAARLASVAATAFHLVGVNTIDFIADAAAPVPIEINPRWSSSMELVARLGAPSVFGAHAAACADGALPDWTFEPHAAIGKAILFAQDGVTMGDTRPWLDDPDVRDVPHPGERIGAGHPICTVFAKASNAAACEAALVSRAQEVFDLLRRWQAA